MSTTRWPRSPGRSSLLLDRRQLLVAAAAGLALPSVSRADAPRRLVVVYCDGGWDVSFCMDPKFHSDEVEGPEVHEDPANPEDREAVRTFGEIPIVVNDFKRPAVTTYFERWHPRTAVVNGIWMGAIAHVTARVRVLTGTQSQANPSVATIAGDVLGDALPLGSIDLSGGSPAGYLASSTGQVGYQSQIKALVVENAAFPAIDPKWGQAPPGTPPFGGPTHGFSADAEDRAQLQRYLTDRVNAVRGRWSDGGRNDAMLDARAEAMLRASRFREEGAGTIAQLQLGAAASLIEQANLAADFLAGDLCRAVTLDSRRFWDSHDSNDIQHGNYQSLFEGLDHLMDQLEQKGLLDDTLVVVHSEFTRTPTLNSTGGKDHWPHTSFLLAGAGVSGGRVFGASDDRLESQKVDLRTGEPDPNGEYDKYDNIAAGILAALDIDPERWFPSITPFTAPFLGT